MPKPGEGGSAKRPLPSGTFTTLRLGQEAHPLVASTHDLPGAVASPTVGGVIFAQNPPPAISNIVALDAAEDFTGPVSDVLFAHNLFGFAVYPEIMASGLELTMPLTTPAYHRACDKCRHSVQKLRRGSLCGPDAVWRSPPAKGNREFCTDPRQIRSQ